MKTWDHALEARLRALYGVSDTLNTDTACSRGYNTEQCRKMALTGVAMPDGSFPVANRGDLRGAIELARTAAQRRHVIRRARAVGGTNLIPDDWNSEKSRAVPAGDGFAVETAGKVILAAPARTLSVADELPTTMRESWEKASRANPYFLWLQGRFVEAGRANSNGAFWSTEDLQFGEMSVRHGPINWLHEAREVIGCIADNKLVTPDHAREVSSTDRPYIAAVSAVWKWIYPEQAHAIEKASETGRLYFSMECIARQVACTTDGHLTGCEQSFDYITAVTQPDQVCEHIRARTCARRMVDPSFLGGAVIVPPVRPGWTGANAEVMRQAAALAEQVAPADAKASDWEHLMAQILNYAEQT